jgi:hypothetical protein
MTYREKKEKGKVKIKNNDMVKEIYSSLPNNCVPIPDFPTYYATPNGEIWRNFPGNGLRLPRIIKLKDRYNPKIRYHQVQLQKNNKKIIAYTHRLVLAAFKGWPSKGYECNHIDANPSNNHINNLEWVTKEYNLSIINRNPRGKTDKRYQTKWLEYYPEVKKMLDLGKSHKEIAEKFQAKVGIISGIIKTLKKHNEIEYKPKRYIGTIDQYDLQGNYIKTWNNAKDAAEALGKKRAGSSMITENCKGGRCKTAYGFIWKYS